MSSRNTTHEQKLASLEKWRNLELDHAQAAHAKTQSQAFRSEQTVTTVRNTIDRSHELMRAQTSDNRIISVDALTRLRHYATVQTGELKKAQASLDESRREVARAREKLLKRRENVSVVERLRKRRNAQAAKESLRREQSRLDDHALLRISSTAYSNDQKEG